MEQIKFNWEYVKIKLTSRKFWLAVISFVSLMLVANGSTENEVAQTGALIMSGAVVIGYMIGNGLKND
jgi:hypothetical protein